MAKLHGLMTQNRNDLEKKFASGPCPGAPVRYSCEFLEGNLRTRPPTLHRVGPSSTISVKHNVYSVHSRLIGERIEVRLYGEHLEVWYGQKQLETLAMIQQVELLACILLRLHEQRETSALPCAIPSPNLPQVGCTPTVPLVGSWPAFRLLDFEQGIRSLHGDQG